MNNQASACDGLVQMIVCVLLCSCDWLKGRVVLIQCELHAHVPVEEFLVTGQSNEYKQTHMAYQSTNRQKHK